MRGSVGFGGLQLSVGLTVMDFMPGCVWQIRVHSDTPQALNHANTHSDSRAHYSTYQVFLSTQRWQHIIRKTAVRLLFICGTTSTLHYTNTTSHQHNLFNGANSLSKYFSWPAQTRAPHSTVRATSAEPCAAHTAVLLYSDTDSINLTLTYLILHGADSAWQLFPNLKTRTHTISEDCWSYNMKLLRNQACCSMTLDAKIMHRVAKLHYSAVYKMYCKFVLLNCITVQ